MMKPTESLAKASPSQSAHERVTGVLRALAQECRRFNVRVSSAFRQTFRRLLLLLLLSPHTHSSFCSRQSSRMLGSLASSRSSALLAAPSAPLRAGTACILSRGSKRGAMVLWFP